MTDQLPSIKKVNIDLSRFQQPRSNQKEIQLMMGLLNDQGWITPKWQGMWGKLLKSSGISSFDLERLIKKSLSLPDKFDKRGFVRNRLKNKDWIKYFD